MKRWRTALILVLWLVVGVAGVAMLLPEFVTMGDAAPMAKRSAPAKKMASLEASTSTPSDDDSDAAIEEVVVGEAAPEDEPLTEVTVEHSPGMAATRPREVIVEVTPSASPEEGERIGGGEGISIGSGYVGGLGSGAGYGAASPPPPPAPRPAGAAPGAAAPDPVGGAAPSTTSSLEADSEVDRILASLRTASIAFNTPDELAFGEATVIELLLSASESPESLATSVTSPGAIHTAQVKFANEMQATLKGLGFRIEPITPEVQAVSRVEQTAWRWEIEPLETDVQPLRLTLSARVKIDGEKVPRTLRTFERTIRVKVLWSQRVRDFARNHSEWLATAILAPLAAALWRRWRRRKTPDDGQAVEPPNAKAA